PPRPRQRAEAGCPARRLAALLRAARPQGLVLAPGDRRRDRARLVAEPQLQGARAAFRSGAALVQAHADGREPDALGRLGAAPPRALVLLRRRRRLLEGL